MLKKALAGCCACLCLCLPLAKAEPVSMRVQDGDVRAVLQAAARSGGLDIILDDSVQGKITIELSEAEPEEALRLIARTKGLLLERQGGTAIIRAGTGGDSGFRQMHVFPIRYAEPDALREAVNLSLGEAGFSQDAKNNRDKGRENRQDDGERRASPEDRANRLFVDRSTNALLLYGTDAEADAVRKALQAVDIPAKQVSLEAKVVAVRKDAAKKLGVEWEWSKLPQYPRSETSYAHRSHREQNPDGSWTTAWEDVPTREVKQRHWGGADGAGIVQFGRGPEGQPYEMYFAATINALVTDGKAELLARPNITTVQGHEALINIGGEVPVPTVETTNATTTTSITYRQAGIILRCTPTVNADGHITAQVHTEVSSPLYVDELKAYRFQKRAADTTVRLRDGETMVIGGLIGSEESRNFSKVPFLGDLPILGSFFRNVKKSKSDSEIMIFLTAHILDDK